MLDFISKDVREYMKQKGIKFTDFEKATLIFHSGLPILEIHSLKSSPMRQMMMY